MRQYYFLFVISVVSQFSFAQEEAEKKEYVGNVFLNTQLITAQTTSVLPENSWEFKIQHRFGKVGLDSSFIQDFFGLDHMANIRLAIGYSINDRLSLGVGRTKHLKTYDLEGKYLLLRQSKNQTIPLSMALYSNVAIRTAKFPKVSPDAYFIDGVTSFKYKSTHRLSYSTQLIISSKLNESISLQLTPILVYRNLVDQGLENHFLSLSFSGRVKLGFRSSIIFEYARALNNRINADQSYIDPASIGLEFGTAGHAFQIFVGSSQGILDQQYYSSSALKYHKAEFLLGFNIKRNFWRN